MEWGYKRVRKDEPKISDSKALAEGFFSINQNPQYYSGLVWNKLFRASLAKSHSFPPGAKMGGEDYCYSIPTYVDAEKCFYLDRALYWHDSTHESLSSLTQTPEVVIALSIELKKVLDYAERATERQRDRETERQRDRRHILYHSLA